MVALAHRIADVAEHEEIAGRGPREPGEIVGSPGPEAVEEALCRANPLRRGCTGCLHLGGERRVDRNAALAREHEEARGKVGIVGRERALDFAAGDLGRQRLFHGVIGEAHRIVLDRDEVRGIEAARRERDRRDAEEHRCRKHDRGEDVGRETHRFRCP